MGCDDNSFYRPVKGNGTVEQHVEIVSFGDPAAKPGPWVPGAYEEAGKQESEQETRPVLTSFEQELRRLINSKSVENKSNTPDMILAEYLCHCLDAFNVATRQREQWYGRKVF